MAVATTLLNAQAYLSIAAVGLLAGCAAGSGPGRDGGATVPSWPNPTADPSYDWRGQITVPFGVLLKSSPVPLHEVLLFHDEAQSVAAPGVADAESKDCYAIEGTPPRFVGQTPVIYLLCFDHDRLNRVESTVRLPPQSAAQVFSKACASWQMNALPAATPAGVCEGRAGTTTFTLRLVSEPGSPATLSLILLNADAVP